MNKRKNSFLLLKWQPQNTSRLSKVYKEADHWNRNSKICKTAYDNAVAVAEVYVTGLFRKGFSLEEKHGLSSTLKDYIDSIPKGKRGDYRVPNPEKIKGVKQWKNEQNSIEYRVDEAWKSGTDGAKAGTRRMVIVTSIDEKGNPTYIDRIGDSRGAYFSPMTKDGTPYSLRERAIGDYLPEDKIEDNDSYHKYEVKQDFTRANFEAAISTYTDPDVRDELQDDLVSFYENAVSSECATGNSGDTYMYSGSKPDGVKMGTIDNMFGTDQAPDGGGEQYITPFKAFRLVEMGMITEVPKEG